MPAEGTPVTCASCNLKYLTRASGTCPRCQTPDSAHAAPAPRTSAPPAHASPDAPSRPVLPLAVVGIALVALVAVAAVWSRSKGDSGDSSAIVAVDCRKIGKILDRADAAVEQIGEAYKKRSSEINLIVTWTDLAKQLDAESAELNATPIVAPGFKPAVDEYASILHHLAEQVRSAVVTARAGDRAQMGRVMDKLRGLVVAERESYTKLSGRCNGS